MYLNSTISFESYMILMIEQQEQSNRANNHTRSHVLAICTIVTNTLIITDKTHIF